MQRRPEGPPHRPQPVLYGHEHDGSGLFLSEDGQLVDHHICKGPVHRTFRDPRNLADHILAFATLPKDRVFVAEVGVDASVMKNWLPLVLGPALAMASRPG